MDQNQLFEATHSRDLNSFKHFSESKNKRLCNCIQEIDFKDLIKQVEALNAKALALIKGQYAILDQLENPKDDSVEDSSKQNDKPVEPNENNNNNKPEPQKGEKPVEPTKIDDSTDKKDGKVDDSANKVDDSANKGNDSADKVDDSANKVDDSADKNDGKVDDSANKVEDSAKKVDDSADKDEDSANKVDDSANKVDDSADKNDDSATKVSPSPIPQDQNQADSHFLEITKGKDFQDKLDEDNVGPNPNADVKTPEDKMYA